MTPILRAVSPRVKARIAGVFWLMVFVAGALAMAVGRGTVFSVANVVAPLCYIVVTLLLYDLLEPVNKPVACIAAIFGLAGCAVSLFGLSRIIVVRDLAFFGVQCLLVGYLIFNSTFLPRALGVLLAFAGLGWLTFLWPALARALSPYNLMPGMLGEGLLLLWLIVVGVNVERWTQQASA